VWTKPYPTLGDHVAVAAAALRLAERSTFDCGHITAIRVHQNAEFASYPGTAYRGPYDTPTQAIASTAFAVAAALARGSLTFDLYSNALDDPEILSLIEKLTVVPEQTYGYLDGKVVVETRGGGEFFAEANQIPRQFFYRDRDTATTAFVSTLREVGIEGDAESFARRLLDRVVRDDMQISAADLLAEAMALRGARLTDQSDTATREA
jgi:2-methylcitrate dehydratase PrpD